MSALVTTDGKSVLTDTQIIAREIGMRHAKVMEMVERFLDDFHDLRVPPKDSNFRVGLSDPKPGDEYIRLEQRNYRGKDFTAAVMNRECFSLLFMRFETPKARQMQREFVRAFFEMEKRLQQSERNDKDTAWIASRESGKLGRKKEADTIKVFVDYATTQGSKHAQFYFANITNATYRALELLAQRKPKIRDTLNCYELAELLLAERLVTVKLQEYMEKGRHYKDIYETVVDDLMAYASSIRLPAAQPKLEKQK